jgi:putative tryptophan/tyrosine transport system substrate-binding protein
MRRTVTLITAFFAAAIAGSGAVAQQVSGLPRVGLLFLGTESASRGSAPFREGMQSLGWTEGSDFSIEYRFADGDPARLSADAVDLAAAKVDAIVAFGPLASQAARHATSMIPIVGATVDPGLVASLARPGGNVTGLTLMMQDITAKQLQLLKESVPGISKVGVLLHPDTPGLTQLMAELERAAATIGVSVLPVVVGTAQDLPRRFNEITAAGADAYFVLSDPLTIAMRDDIAGLALRHRLPGAAQLRTFVEAGVLLSYAASLSAAQRRAALFVDKILKGAKPADLPVEQPTTFELVVNLNTARALGLTIPPSILARADEVIE